MRICDSSSATCIKGYTLQIMRDNTEKVKETPAAEQLRVLRSPEDRRKQDR